MKKKVALFGVSDKAHRLSRTVNTGNMLHAAAGRKIVGDFEEVSSMALWPDELVERLNSDFSHCVFIAANGIRLGVKDSDAAEIHKVIKANLERVNLPVVVFGLGSQANMAVKEFCMPKPTEELMQLIGERSINIAVRGLFTAEALEKIGVKNSVIMGCPSNFWHLSPHFPVPFKPVNNLSANEVAFNYTGPLREQGMLMNAVRKGYDLIGQEHVFERDLCAGNISDQADIPFGHMFKEEKDWLDFKNAITKRFYMYYDLQDWFDKLKTRRFVYGTRFHGNMTGLQCGTKALWVTHDPRTVELCEYHGLPHIPLAEANAMTSLDEFVERADYSEYIAKFPTCYSRFYHYLQAAGLPNQMPKPYDVSLQVGAESKENAPILAINFNRLMRTVQSQNERIYELQEELKGVRTGIQRIGRLLTTGCADTGANQAQAQPAAAPPQAAPAADRKGLSRGVDYNRSETLRECLGLGIEAVAQTETNTNHNRYPDIFTEGEKVSRTGLSRRILSFGCSSGEEVESLAKYYFTNPEDKLCGVDINEEMLAYARLYNPEPKRIEYINSCDMARHPKHSYDIVFVMSVLCAWPMSKDRKEISDLYPFERFERMVAQIDSFVKPGGHLVIFNSNYSFLDAYISGNYEPVDNGLFLDPKFVHLFDKESKLIQDTDVKIPVIYRKRD